MFLLSVMILAIAVIFLGPFFGKMIFFVACVFCLYLFGTMVVSYLSHFFSKAWHTPRKSRHFMLV